MAFSDIRSFWSLRTGSGGTSNSASAPHGEHNFLPQTSVDISDRTRRANRLGEGSFAKVYRGEYNGKPCAVKVFKEDILKKGLTLDPGSEVKMVSRLKHKNIVQIYGMWLDPHKDRAAPSIVMELCDESLYDFSRRFKGKIVPKVKKLPLLQDIASGMVYLHDQNIVHGDLRSSNVLLCHSEDRTVAKVADFDMARFLDPDTQHHFTIRFTDDQYLPPEVFDHKERKDHQKKVARLTPKVDVFCFGELVLEMGCGTYPTPTRKFRGQEMLTELQRRERHMLKLKQSDKESFGSIIQKCLADAPEGRPSFTEILLEVNAYLHKYGERPDLEVLQDKTAECEVLRAEAVKWEDDPKSLCGMQDELEKELEKERTENQDLQIHLQIQQTKVEELQQQIQDISQRERDAAEKSLTMSNSLQSQLQEARDDLRGKAQLVDTRDAELKVLHGKLVDLEQQMKDDQNAFQEGYRKVVDEKDKLSHDLVKVKQDTEDLKKTLEEAKTAAEKELDKTKKEKDALREHVQATHEALSKKTNEHAEAMKEVASLNEALDQKASNIGELQSKSRDQEKVIQQLNRDRLNMQQEVEQLKSQRDTFKQTLDEAQTSLKTSKEHTASVEEQRDQFQKKLREKESANAKLLQSLKDKEGEMKEVKQQKAKLENSTKRQDDRMTQLKTKADEMDVQLKKERQEWTLERNALQQQNAELKKNVSEMDEQLRRESKKWQSEKTALKLEVATGKEHAKTSLKTSKEHTTSVEEQLDHFQKKLREKESANAKLSEEMKEMKQQKAKLESSAKGQDNRITQLKTKADVVDVQLKKERQEWTLERNALRQQNAELKIQVAQLEETQSSMAATTSQLEQAAAARDKMETSLLHLREKCDHLEQEHQETLAEKVEELNSMKREHEREMQALKETHETLIAAKEKSLTEKSQDVARLQADLQTEESKVQAMENTAQEREKECDQIKKDFDETVKTFETTVEALQKELEDTVEHSKTCESERDHLRDEKRVWVKRKADLEDCVKKLKETCTGMEQSRMELHAQLKELKAENEAAKTQLKSDSKKMSSLQAENEAVRTQQKEDSKKMSSLEVALQTEKDKLCNAEKAMCQKEKEIKKCKADLQAEKDKVHTMEKAALQKDRDLDQCRTELKILKAKKKHQENAVMTELQEKLHRAEDVRVKLLGEKEDQKKREAALHDTVKELEQQHSNLVEKALKEKEEHLKQYRDVERKLHRLSGNHAKKMAESEKEIQRLKDQLEEARKKQLTVQAQEQEAPEEQHMDKEVTRLQEEISQLKEQLKALKEGKEQAKRQSEDLRLQNTELQNELAEMASKKDSLDAQLVTVNEEKRALLVAERKLTSEMEETQKELERMTVIAEKSAEEKDKESQECQQLQERLKTLKEGKEQAKRQSEDLRLQNTELQEKAARLQGELAESQRASETQRNELVVTHVQRQLAEKERDKLAEKYHEADQLICRLKQEAEVTRKDLQNIKEKNAELRGQLGVVVENQHELEALRLKYSSAVEQKARAEEQLLAASKDVLKLKEEAGEAKRHLHEAEKENEGLQDRCSDLEADNASKRFPEELLKAERDEYRGKPSNSKELIMKHLCTQDEEGSLEHLLEKTQFNAIFMEKLREAEQQVALLQDRQQQLEYIEGVAVELKTHLSGFMMDALPLLTPSVGGGEDESSTTVLTQEAAQKVQLLESERDSLKAERHMYQMKWLAAEDMLETVKNARQSIQDERDSLLRIKDALEQEKKDMKAKQTGLEEELRVKQEDLGKTKESLESSKLALHGAKVLLQVTEQSLREEYKREKSEAYEAIKRLQHPQEGSAEYPSEKTKISALMDLCKYFRDENMETLERAAEEKQKIHASMKEADEREKKMASTIAALKECIQVQDAEIRDLQAQLAPHQGMAVVPIPPPSDVADLTGDEVVLEQLCYMATGIKQLLISPDGGTFTLGNGDASLKFPPGAVQEDIHVRYAIILYGPFVFSAGYKPGSVVIYLKMDGATLVKPVQLFLSHWCIREETDDEESMKFIRAPHSLESGKKEYAFEEIEEETDFNTHSDMGVLTIKEPHCLYCVEAKGAKNARYCAMTFTRYIPSKGTLLFRIQLLCASLEWIKKLPKTLGQNGWQESEDVHPFSFSAECIAASTTVSEGPGWKAVIEGTCQMKEADFLMLKGKSKAAIDQEVIYGLFPPHVCYKILYRIPEERRVMPTFLEVDLHGADRPLTFTCRLYEAENPTSPVSPAFFSSATSPRTPGRMAASYGPSPATSGHIPSAERHPSSRQAEISQPAATAVPDAVTDGPSATTPPTETAADILDHFRDQFINDAASSDIMYELKHKDVISSGDVEMIERKAGVTQQNQYLHKCLTGKCTKEALMEVCNVMEAVKGNPRINALGKDMRRRVKASYGPSPATSGPIPSAERHPSSPQAETSKTADPTSPVSPAFFSSATSPRTPGRMTASYGPSPATSGHIPSAERHPSSPQAEISKPTEVIEALNHDLDAQWREFGTHLCVKPSSMDIIDKNNKSDAGACMLQLVEKWLVQENGTGDLPRTWVTVVQAVKKTGKGRLAEELAQRYGVQLPGQ